LNDHALWKIRLPNNGKWRAVDRTPFAHPISQNPLPGGKILAVEQFPLPNQ